MPFARTKKDSVVAQQQKRTAPPALSALLRCFFDGRPSHRVRAQFVAREREMRREVLHLRASSIANAAGHLVIKRRRGRRKKIKKKKERERSEGRDYNIVARSRGHRSWRCSSRITKKTMMMMMVRSRGGAAAGKEEGGDDHDQQ